MKRWGAFVVSSVVFVGLVVALLRPPAPEVEAPLLVYCAAGLRPAVEAAAKAYDREVQLQYGGSQTLLANAELTRQGDLYIPADESYLALARGKGLTVESMPLARMRPVVAVPKGNPKAVRSLADLMRPEIRVAQANPDAAAIGKLVRAALDAKGAWAALQAKTLVFKPTVNEVANDLKLGTADAGFLWDATVKQYPELEALELPELAGLQSQIPVAVLKTAARPAAALRFARFLSAKDRGLKEFERFGYRPVDGDPWEEQPTLLVYAGAMLRPAIEQTIAAFERREGCTVTRVYNGCGILVAQMKAGENPDLYFACDPSFMEQVQDRFSTPKDVSLNQLVILVPKGNPHKIRALQDLARPGLKLGVGHEKQCALGQLTQTTLIQSKIHAQVMKNVVVQTPTGDMLVNQLRAGSLDAVIAYVSNAVSAADVLEALPLDIPCAIAAQPVAIARGSAHTQLARRLQSALESAESRARFEAEGFRWKASP